ncbi:MAG: ribosome modulation factor [Pseudomonadota bacterium]
MKKRVKRSPENRAYQKGYLTGIGHRSKELCPFVLGERREHWVQGWRAGRADLWDGLTGISNLGCRPLTTPAEAEA